MGLRYTSAAEPPLTVLNCFFLNFFDGVLAAFYQGFELLDFDPSFGLFLIREGDGFGIALGVGRVNRFTIF